MPLNIGVERISHRRTSRNDARIFRQNTVKREVRASTPRRQRLGSARTDRHAMSQNDDARTTDALSFGPFSLFARDLTEL